MVQICHKDMGVMGMENHWRCHGSATSRIGPAVPAVPCSLWFWYVLVIVDPWDWMPDICRLAANCTDSSTVLMRFMMCHDVLRAVQTEDFPILDHFLQQESGRKPGSFTELEAVESLAITA